jgi:hypothetical protein
MARPAWMKREQRLIWIVAAIVLTMVVAAIGYRLVGQLSVLAAVWRWLRTTG